MALLEGLVPMSSSAVSISCTICMSTVNRCTFVEYNEESVGEVIMLDK